MDKTTINFSCNLDVETENEPWQKLADELGIARTTYFKKMIAQELKHKVIYEKMNI